MAVTEVCGTGSTLAGNDGQVSRSRPTCACFRARNLPIPTTWRYLPSTPGYPGPRRRDIMSPGTTTARKTEIYNDPSFDYAKFWAHRSYEHQAEVIALRRLLDGHRFGTAVDIGGGYGRISVILTEYADQVTLTDPSTQQLSLAER